MEKSIKEKDNADVKRLFIDSPRLTVSSVLIMYYVGYIFKNYVENTLSDFNDGYILCDLFHSITLWRIKGVEKRVSTKISMRNEKI